mgnify:CR=1 FL=1
MVVIVEWRVVCVCVLHLLSRCCHRSPLESSKSKMSPESVFTEDALDEEAPTFAVELPLVVLLGVRRHRPEPGP